MRPQPVLTIAPAVGTNSPPSPLTVRLLPACPDRTTENVPDASSYATPAVPCRRARIPGQLVSAMMTNEFAALPVPLIWVLSPATTAQPHCAPPHPHLAKSRPPQVVSARPTTSSSG